MADKQPTWKRSREVTQSIPTAITVRLYAVDREILRHEGPLAAWPGR